MSIIQNESELRDLIGHTVPGLEEKNIDFIDHFAREFIERCPFLVLSTSDDEGRQDASPKGDAPGFVEVLDDKTLLIPDRPGNKLAYGHENILKNPRVGLLFMIPGTSETLRINGRAELDSSEELRAQLEARGKPAVLVIRVTVDECFFHCAKAFIRSRLWQPDEWATPHKVSFGKMFAERKKLTDDVADAIDESVEEGYKNDL